MNKGLRPDPRTMPVTKEYSEGHARIFGDSKEKVAGRFKWSKELGKLVVVGSDEDIDRDTAKNNLFTDRFMEKDITTEGIDISSRSKRRKYMKERGITDSSDYGSDYSERVKARNDREERKSLRETVERVTYRLWKP